MDVESNEDVHSKFGMSRCSEGMKCGVVEMVMRSTLRWFGYIERMPGSEIT